MDKIFKAIGGFFKKIWDWIKSTAWIQPLLIVAIIFGIIFSIQPIVGAIKDAASSDKAGEFYEDHAVKSFNRLYAGIKDQNYWYQSRVRRNKVKLNSTSGDVLVVYIDSDSTLEDAVSHFYASANAKGCKLYICNFKYKKNQKSTYDDSGKWYEHGYKDDGGETYYNFLLDRLEEAYNGDTVIAKDAAGNDLTWQDYNKEFNAKYGYDVYFKGFTEKEVYDTKAFNSSADAKNCIKLPAAVKYHNGNIVDMRFATSASWTGYSDKSTATDLSILTDMWVGAYSDNFQLI